MLLNVGALVLRWFICITKDEIQILAFEDEIGSALHAIVLYKLSFCLGWFPSLMDDEQQLAHCALKLVKITELSFSAVIAFQKPCSVLTGVEEHVPSLAIIAVVVPDEDQVAAQWQKLFLHLVLVRVVALVFNTDARYSHADILAICIGIHNILHSERRL